MFKREKEITIYDLADNLNLSIATVSRALKNDPVVNKETKKKVIDLAERVGYRTNHFAKNLRSQKTNTLGVIIPRLNSYFMSTVIAGMESVANKAGYNLIISQSAEDHLKEIESTKTMFMNRVDGLLVSLTYDSPNLQHFNPFVDKKIPVIFFDRTEEHASFTSIILDNEQAAFDATSHLLDQGCRTIVHLSAMTPRAVYKDRLSGYKRALNSYNIEFDPTLIIPGNLNLEAGEAAADLIKNMDKRPDGIFAANDSSAVGCIIRLKQYGIHVPQDIAVVGFNNDPISIVVEPNLSTINYPGYEMGELAATQLINHLNGSLSLQKTKTILLHHELMVRGSSKRN